MGSGLATALARLPSLLQLRLTSFYRPPPWVQLGLELTLVSRALTYDSLQDALDDLSSLAALPAKAAESLQALQGRASAVGQQQQRQQQTGKSEA